MNDAGLDCADVQAYMSLEEFARYLGAKVGTVREWRKQGKLPSAFKFGRLVRWKRIDVERWANARREEGERRMRIAVELGQASLGTRRCR
jgi:excisionase family DNA binding protein